MLALWFRRSGLVTLATALKRRGLRMAARTDHVARSALHMLGLHDWRDGYETDNERGWRRYRGARCTVCDAPWEGW